MTQRPAEEIAREIAIEVGKRGRILHDVDERLITAAILADRKATREADAAVALYYSRAHNPRFSVEEVADQIDYAIRSQED